MDLLLHIYCNISLYEVTHFLTLLPARSLESTYLAEIESVDKYKPFPCKKQASYEIIHIC